MGPVKCPLPFLKGRHRWHLFVKTGHPTKLSRLLTGWENEKARFGLPSSVRITIDVDPDDMM